MRHSFLSRLRNSKNVSGVRSRPRHEKKSYQKGSVLLEFSIAAPLFIVFLLSVYDIGTLIVQRTTLLRLARESSRIASTSPMLDIQCSYDGTNFYVYPPPTGGPPVACIPATGHPAVLTTAWNLVRITNGTNGNNMLVVSNRDAVAKTSSVQFIYQYPGVMFPFRNIQMTVSSVSPTLPT